MSGLQKIFFQMVAYSLLGIVVGAVIAFLFGTVLDLFYQHPEIEFRTLPMVPAAGGALGGILAAVLVIKYNKFS